MIHASGWPHVERGWYQFPGHPGTYFWDGTRWQALMIVVPPLVAPVKSDPPK